MECKYCGAVYDEYKEADCPYCGAPTPKPEEDDTVKVKFKQKTYEFEIPKVVISTGARNSCNPCKRIGFWLFCCVCWGFLVWLGCIGCMWENMCRGFCTF